MTSTSRAALAAACTAALALTLSACGSGDDEHTSASHMSHMSSTSSAAPAAAAGRQGDIAFAQQMIPHHRQAVQMSDLALGRNGVSADVTRLATSIKRAQGPEISTMSGWLRSWGAQVPSTGAHSGHDMSGMPGMPGMMSEQDMADLKGARGAAFDRMWLTMMIKHHQGAVTMATAVTKTTSNTQVNDLANAIITGQNAEIRTMQNLLGPASS
ncbi:DUF305 domain-containing protein [Luteipulveratus halotolerans]|uniref:DUF305 domain-containing protein n=1 Tax=Luteipulveratus halotolerans TaxID=1631356 RepID=A0A0L6CJQ7_9MICO|nr:DUF305 domain-containing protein [Luteipulveratus halotolerans]KNX38026.1 hypothetical protein VV01_14115 [Luteipulveratus halotolerans]